MSRFWSLFLGVVLPTALRVAHLFLPAFQRTIPKPGWYLVYLAFWPIVGWLVLVAHLLLLVAIGCSAMHRWRYTFAFGLTATLGFLLVPTAPLTYSGIQALAGACVCILVTSVAGLVTNDEPGGAD